MKILIVSHNYFPAIGGAEKKIKEISERLVKSGEEVTVFSSNAHTTEAYIHPEIPLLFSNSELINGVRVRRFPVYQGMRQLLNRVHSLFWKYRLPFNDIVRTIWNGPIIFNMLPHILKQKTDIIVATPFPFLNMYYAYIAKKIRKIPMAIIPCLHTEDAWAFDRKIMYKILSDTEMILTNTGYEKNYLITKGVEKKRIFTLGDGINPQDFNRSNPQKFRKRYDIGNAPVVLFVGRKEKGKGIDTLLDSMSIVWGKFPQAKLMVAGTKTSYSKEIEKKVSWLDGKKRRNIILIDNFKDSEKSDLFASADVFAMPSTVESLGIVYLEAWASGKPVIGCRIGAVSSLIEEGKDGLLVEYGNHQELASAILKLMDNEDLRRKLGENGKKKAYGKYTWDIITKRFRENLNLAISKDNRSSRLQSAFIRKQGVLRKNLVIPEGFRPTKINRISLKDSIKKILRKVPVLFYAAYYVYRKVEKFTRPVTNRWILYKTQILIKNNPIKLKTYDLMKLKTYNEQLAEEEQRRHSPITRAMPTKIFINMGMKCNLKCIMCIRRTISKDLNKIEPDFEIFKNVADQVFPYIRIFGTTVVAEPLLGVRFLEQLRIAEMYSVKADIVTNATLLSSDTLIRKILEGACSLEISLDAARKETYESIRVGGNFEQVKENIRRFNSLKKKMPPDKRPFTTLCFLLMRRNIEELPEFIKLAKELEADCVALSHVSIFTEEMKKESLIYCKELSNKYLVEAKREAKRLGVNLYTPSLFEINKNSTDVKLDGLKERGRTERGHIECPFLWKQASIQWNGNVFPCCVPGQPLMGNVREKPFREIWNNELYQEMRKRLNTNDPFECCKHCFTIAPDDDDAYVRI